MSEPLYPCAHPGCTVMRTKAQGGTTFTVCDEHWDARQTAAQAEAVPGDAVGLARRYQYIDKFDEPNRLDVRNIARAVLALHAENERLRTIVANSRFYLRNSGLDADVSPWLLAQLDTLRLDPSQADADKAFAESNALHARERELCEALREALHEWESWMPGAPGNDGYRERIAELRKLAGPP